jgi:hypothetical protein
VFTLLACVLEFLVIGDFAAGAEEILTEVGVDARFLGGDAPLDEEEGDLGEEAVDVFGRGEGAGGFGEFGGGELGGGGLVGAAKARIG